jgi:hypothetical protein
MTVGVCIDFMGFSEVVKELIFFTLNDDCVYDLLSIN